MAIYLGLDIGSNSVGSAWVDTEASEIVFGVSIFPAGVDETDTKRGAPKNQKRRQSRSQRRSIRRRAARKRHLRQTLVDADLLPENEGECQHLMQCNPWHLRRDGLQRALTPYEFGRVLVHLNQRRGAVGIETDPEDTEEGKVKEAIDQLKKQLNGRTFGQFMADLYDSRKERVKGKTDNYFRDSIRNRRDAFEFHADRSLIRDEFEALWKSQSFHDSDLSKLLTENLKRQLDNPVEDSTWRHQGAIFGQRRTYWDTGTLGRCDLEPTDRCCPHADMYAQEFRVLETVNNIRIEERDKSPRPLRGDERDKVIDVLRRQKTASIPTIRRALGIHRKQVKAFYTLNIERDPDRKINTDWFYLEFVHGIFTEDAWRKLTDRQRDSVNRAILKFDPDNEGHTSRLRQGAQQWWGLSSDQVEKLISAWQGRPKLERRLNLSQRALKNLIPYMNRFDNDNQRWPTQIEARQRFADDPTNGATNEQRRRYQLGVNVHSRADRHFLQKHPNLLPPAPMLSNPVVRKAIHEVRRHLNEYLRRFERKPDRVVVELARSATQPEIVRNQALALNRRRDQLRKRIIEEFGLADESLNQQARAIERVLLCRQQGEVCAYSGRTITERMAADGTELEVDHIVPKSRSHDNGSNNKLLCFVKSNRGKGNMTPKEWYGQESEAFKELEHRLRHFEASAPSDDYFTKKNYARKWENLHRDAPASDEFAASQLTDTAYASRQVTAYLRDTLYASEPDETRRVFTTKGGYTAILRRDWGIVESELDRQSRRSMQPSPETKPGESGTARRDKKDRSDHLHHAIDAVCIAFATGRTIQDLAHFTEEQEKAKAELGYWPKRKTLDPPWGTKDEFRSQVLNTVSNLVVSHRPVKRRLVGFLHKEEPFGPVLDNRKRFTKRINAIELRPAHLRMPNGWNDTELSRNERNSLLDATPRKSGIVRDRVLREQIRRCLLNNELDPDDFSKQDIKRLVDNGKLRMDSGVPIYRIVLLRTLSDPVIIPSRSGDPHRVRVYESQSNHHIEIREDSNTGQWSGQVLPTFHVANRIRQKKLAAVDRSDQDGKRFVMSLAEGETIHAHRKDRDPESPGAIDYFVVAKLDKNRIHFAPHWDARRANEQDRWSVTPPDLKACGPVHGEPPYKVRVSPLGVVTAILND